VVVRYLFDELPEEERARFEEEYFCDDSAFEQLEIIESELTDDYVRGRLSSGDRVRFEGRLLRSSRLRERVEFAKTLTTSVARESLSRSQSLSWSQLFRSFVGGSGSRVRMSLAAGGLVVVITSVVLWVQTARLRDELEQSRAETAKLERRQRDIERESGDVHSRNEELARELERERELRQTLEAQVAQAPPSEGSIVSLLLTPALVRDPAEARVLSLPRNASAARLQFVVEITRYKRYRLTLTTVEGSRVWVANGLRLRSAGSARTIVVTVPANRLAAGDYLANIEGISPIGEGESIADYYFRVVRK
jgi:hypothetical protein